MLCTVVSRYPYHRVFVCYSVWGCALVAITVISLVGLVAVAVIPLMSVCRRQYFDGLLQFLIALAVGTLTGDALLHLLPHVSTFNSGTDFVRSL